MLVEGREQGGIWEKASYLLVVPTNVTGEKNQKDKISWPKDEPLYLEDV